MCSVSVCQCVHNLRSISLDYPGQALLPNWLTKFSKPLSLTRRDYITPLVLHAEQLTMQLALPLWVAHCLYSKSGLFWPKWLSGRNNLPSLLKIWRIIRSSYSPSKKSRYFFIIRLLLYLLSSLSIGDLSPPFGLIFLVSAVPSCSFLFLTRSSQLLSDFLFQLPPFPL